MASTRSGRGRRRVTSAEVRRSILVVSEGEKTEVQYLQEWARHYRNRVRLEFHPRFGRVPMQIVADAVEAKSVAQREQRRGRGSAHDSVWCVFDVDEHPDIPNAMAMASAHGIKVALSNPCFELWLLLHFREQTAWLDRHQARSELKAVSGIDKVIPEEVRRHLIEQHDIATQRAKELARRHTGTGDPETNNPSSRVWALVDEIRSAGPV